MKKRVLSIILAMSMVLSAIPCTVFAYEAPSDMADNQKASSRPLPQDENNTPHYIVRSLNEATADVQRYTVLVLDNSASNDFLDAWSHVFYTADTAVAYVKASAKRFIKNIQSANGTNYVAIVTYKGAAATVVSAFSTDLIALTASIDGIYASGNTRNVAAGLQSADALIGSIPNPDAIKNVVLFTTGMTNDGSYSYSGHYGENSIGSVWRRTDTQVRLYAYANIAYSAAASLKSAATLYTIGLFQTMDDMPDTGRDIVQFFKLCALEWATSPNHFYDVKDPNDLEFTFGGIADDIVKEGSGIFSYGTERNSDSSKLFEDYSSTYFYNDNYFSSDASAYKQSLATMSLCFALSAFGSNAGGTFDYYDKSRNARDLLGKIGFADFEANSGFTVKPSEDSMGVVIAHKNIKANGKDYTLIALATRGGGYEAEWAGNFSVGLSGQHEGFKKASDEAYRFLADYINRHKSKFQSDVKLWFAGYSRGGATANLLAGRLNDDKQISGIAVNKENLYAYCFEPPMGALKSQTQPVANYSNIHNIVNPNDPVPKVAMLTWGFARYGKDQPVIPSVLTSSNANDFREMLDYYKTLNTDSVVKSLVKINGKDRHIIDTFQTKKIDPDINIYIGHWEHRTGWFGIKYWAYVPNFEVDARLISNDNKTMSVFLDELLVSLSYGVGGRANYYAQLQQAVRLISSEFMGKGYESYKWQKVPDVFDIKIKDHILDIAAALLTSGVSGAENLVMGYLLESISEAGINLYAYAAVPNALGEALVSVVRAVVVSVCANGGNDLVTLFSKGIAYTDSRGEYQNKINATKISAAHYPELCLAWMQARDDNYGGQEKMYINGYRIIHINCPVDVDVYNSKGALAAQIINNIPQEIDDSTIVSSYNANGEKVIYLPADDDYRLKITATGNGEFNYSVNEFSYDTYSFAKIVNYFDISINRGDIIEGLAPKYCSSDINDTGAGSGVKYVLSINSMELTPASEILGENAQKAIYSVSSAVDNIDGGTVVGGGVFCEGSYAQFAAIAYEKCEFAGWYENDTLVSSEAIYRFRVEKDTVLIAKYIGKRPTPESGTYTLTISAGPGGNIAIGANGNYGDGSITPLFAIPNSNYRFKNWTSSNGGYFADANNADTTFTMPATATAITANFEKAGGNNNASGINGGSGGNGSGGGGIDDDNSGSGGGSDVAVIYTVIFKTNGGNKIESQRISLNGKIAKPASPIKHGYKFAGWYMDKELKKEYDFNTTVTSDLTIYAKWKKIIINKWFNPFADVKPSDWFYDAVCFVAQNGITQGVSSTSYAPQNTVTRAQFITMLCRAYGIEEKSGDNFNDAGNTWYTGYLAAAKQLRISYGVGNNQFAPEQPVTREQMMTLIYNYIVSIGEGPVGVWAVNLTYSDIDQISDWAAESVMFGTVKQWVKGKGSEVFDPAGTATRAELAQIFYNIFTG